MGSLRRKTTCLPITNLHCALLAPSPRASASGNTLHTSHKHARRAARRAAKAAGSCAAESIVREAPTATPPLGTPRPAADWLPRRALPSGRAAFATATSSRQGEGRAQPTAATRKACWRRSRCNLGDAVISADRTGAPISSIPVAPWNITRIRKAHMAKAAEIVSGQG